MNNNNNNPDEPVRWQKWATEASLPTKAERKRPSAARCSLKLLEKLQEELNTSAVHLFPVRRQHQIYSGLTQDVPEGWLVTTVDFGENFTSFFENKAQAVHWTQIVTF